MLALGALHVVVLHGQHAFMWPVCIHVVPGRSRCSKETRWLGMQRWTVTKATARRQNGDAVCCKAQNVSSMQVTMLSAEKESAVCHRTVDFAN